MLFFGGENNIDSATGTVSSVLSNPTGEILYALLYLVMRRRHIDENRKFIYRSLFFTEFKIDIFHKYYYIFQHSAEFL